MKWVVFGLFLIVLSILVKAQVGEIDNCINVTSSGNWLIINNLFSDSTCLVINSSNVNIDCNFHKITGTNLGSGIVVVDSQNLSLINCQIRNFDKGMSVKNSSGILYANMFFNNTIGFSTDSRNFNLIFNSFSRNRNFSLSYSGVQKFNISDNYWNSLNSLEISNSIFGNVNFTPFLTIDPYGDTDSDTIFDIADNCINDYNPDQLDKDRDGKGDACDINLFIRGFVFDPLTETINVSSDFLTDQENGYFFIQYFEKNRTQFLSALNNINAQSLGPISDNAFFVRADTTLVNLNSLPGVRFAGIWQPAFRVTTDVLEQSSGNVTGTIRLDMHVFRNISGVESKIFSFGANVRRLYGPGDSNYERSLYVEIEKSLVANLSRIADVENIEAHFVPQLELSQSTLITGIRDTPGSQNVLGLTGSGQILGEMDSGLDTGNIATLSPDVNGRVAVDPAIKNGWADNDSTAHGTHVIGIAIGDGSSRPAGNIRGVAPKANLFFSSVLGDPTDTRSLTDIWNSAYSNGVRVHGNSWGGGVLNQYGTSSVDVDTFALAHMDFLFVKSAGNSGRNNRLRSITQPGVAKNILTVGNSETVRALPAPPAAGPFAGSFTSIYNNSWYGTGIGRLQMAFKSSPITDEANSDNDISNSSSKGLTNDGRIKPDVTAPGSWVLSLRSQVCGTRNDDSENISDVNADGVLNRNDCVGPGLPGSPINGYGGGYAVVDLQRTDTGATVEANIGVRNTLADFNALKAQASSFYAVAVGLLNVTNIRPIPANPNAPGDPADAPFYQYLTGTSMAQPHVSGSALLVREYLKNYRKQNNASAMLVKAFIINGAQDMPPTPNAGSTGPIPNGLEGWGRLNLTASVNPSNIWNRVQFEDPLLQLNVGDTFNVSMVRFSKDYPIAITLTWFDPIDAGKAGTLVNNLDLKLTSPSNKIYYGGANSFVGGQTAPFAPPGVTQDNTNNVEKIFIRTPEDGFYDISIIASALLSAPQNRFAVVFSQVVGVDSSNSVGKIDYNFSLGEGIFAQAVGLPNGTDVFVYVLPDVGNNFNNVVALAGKDKTERQASLKVKTSSDGSFNVKIWDTSKNSEQIIKDYAALKGNYHIVIDIDDDKQYVPGVDVVDYHNRPGFNIKCGTEENGHTCALIESAISTGKKEQFFNKDDTVYAKIVAFSSDKTWNSKIFAVKLGTLNEGANLNDVTGQAEQLPIQKGVLKDTVNSMWQPELKGGDFDLVLDTDGNSKYNSSIDFADQDGFTVLDIIEQVRFAIGPDNILHAVGIQRGRTSKLLYGFSDLKKFKVNKKHPELYEFSTDNNVKWTVLREGSRGFYANPDVTVDGKGNPYVIAETHISGFEWLLFMVLNGTTGTLNKDFDKDVNGIGDPTDVLIFHWDDFWDPRLTQPRIEIDPTNNLPVVSSKVFLMYPDTFYFQEIYPSLFITLSPIIPIHPLVPFFFIPELAGAPIVYFGDSLQVATYAHGGTNRDGTINWPFLWDHTDATSGQQSTSGSLFRAALFEESKVTQDITTASPRNGNWHFRVVDEVRGLGDDIGNGDLAVDGLGDIHVAYYRRENKNTVSPFKLFYSKLDAVYDNTTMPFVSKVEKYTIPKKVSDKVASGIFYPAIDVDIDKKAHVVWQGADAIHYAYIDADIVAAARPDENALSINTLQEKQIATLTDTSINARPDIVVKANIDRLVAYRDKDSNGKNTIFLAKSNASLPNVDFSMPKEIIKTSDYSNNPEINHNSIEINRYASTFFEEVFVGWTEVLGETRNLKYKKSMPHTTFLILIDGLSSQRFNQLLGQGKLPTIEKLLNDYEDLSGVAVTTFPETTFATYTSIMTGLYPKNHKVPGDSFKHNNQNYDFFTDPNKVNNYLTTRSVKTIFDYLGEGGYSSAAVASIYNKGIGTKPDDEVVSATVNFQAGTIGNFNSLVSYLDGLNERDKLNSNDIADFVSVYLLSNDHGISTNPNAIDYTSADSKLKQIIDKLESKGIMQNSIFIITSDHGFKDVSKDNVHGIKEAKSNTNGFPINLNGEVAYYYLPTTQVANQLMLDAQGLEDMSNDATSTIFNKIESIYVKDSGTYKLFKSGILSGANNPIKNLYSDASGDIMLIAKEGYYFAPQPKESIEFSGLLSPRVPLVITGKFYEALINKSMKPAKPYSVIDIMRTIAYAVGGDGLADSINVDGKHLFLPEMTVTVGSPVNLHLFDSQGNHVGILPDGSIDESIPLAQFTFDNRSKKSEISLLQAPDIYDILIEAFDAGNFTLSISKNTENESFSVIFPTIDISPESRAILNDFSSENLNLQFDFDGDNIFESVFGPNVFSSVIQNEDNTTINLHANAGHQFVIDLLDEMGVMINGTANATITGANIQIRRMLNNSLNSSGFYTIPEVIFIDAESGLADKIEDLKITVRYKDALLGILSESSLSIYNIESGIPQQINAAFDDFKNEFSGIEQFGQFIIASGDQNPVINSIVVTPSVTTSANANISLQVDARDNSQIILVNAEFLGQIHTLTFNPSTSLFEKNLTGPPEDGIYQFIVTAYDNSSNFAQATYATLTVDTKAPNVTITSPASNQVIKQNLVSVEFEINELVVNATYSIDAGEELEADQNGFVVNVTHGLHTLKIIADDLAGNVGTASVNFEIPAKNIEVSSLEVPAVAKPSDEMEVLFDVRNTGNETENVTIQLIQDATLLDTKSFILNPSQSILSKFDYSPLSGTHNLTVRALPIPVENYLVDNQLTASIFVSNKTVALLVDDETNSSSRTIYENAIRNAGLEVLNLDTETRNLSSRLLNDFRLVVWFVGDEQETLSFDEREVLADYMANGGFLILSGNNIGQEIGEDEFYSDSLKARFKGKVSGLENIAGIPGDSISRGILTGISESGESVEASDENGKTIFTYIGDGSAAIKVDDNNKKIVYFSFGFENIENSNDRNLIMSRIVQDFDIDIDAPAIINANPASGFGLDINTTNVTLTIKTNEFAECRIADEFGIRFRNMNIFNNTNSTVHSTSISGLQNGKTITKFIKCQDKKKNTISSSHNFFVHNRTFLPPVLTDIPNQVVNENSLLNIPISVFDPENDLLTFAVEDILSINFPRPIAGKFDIINNSLILNTNFDDAGEYRLRLKVSDGSVTVSDEFTLEISNVNRKPIVNAIPLLNADEDSFFSFNATANDPDGDAIIFGDNTTLFNINLFTGAIAFTPRQQNIGMHHINISVSDGDLAESTQMTLNIRTKNDAPTLEFVNPQFATEGILFTLQLNSSDQDGDTLSFFDNTTLFNVSNAGLISFTPQPSDKGTHFIKLTVSDGSLETSKILNLIITGINKIPIIKNITRVLIVSRNQTANISVVACDPDIDPLCI